MALAPNGQFIAFYTQDGRILVFTLDFQKRVAEIVTEKQGLPLQMEWCGSDSIVLHWPDTVWLVGPAGDWIKYTYEGAVFLVSEPDGVRVHSLTACDFLQKVPNSTEEVFKIGSTAPGAVLYDARDLYEVKPLVQVL
jgi:hypothetical protein